MIKSLGRYVVIEIFILYVFEFILSTVFVYRIVFNPSNVVENDYLRSMACGRALLCSLILSLSSVALGFYRSDICLSRRKHTMIALTLAICLACLLELISNFIAPRLSFRSNDCLRLDLMSAWITCIAVMRIALLLAHQHDLFAKKVLVVGSSQSALRIQNVINSSGGHLCQFVGNIVLSTGRNTKPVLSAFDIAELRRQRIWGVVLARDTAESVPRESFLAHVMRLKQFRHAYVFDEAGFCENRLQRLDPDALPTDWPRILANAAAPHWTNLIYRLVDIVGGSGLLVLTLPLFALLALAIRIESAGPVFNSQLVLGQHGQRFMLHKFRSKTGSKVTEVGRFMRSLHFDGLPQLLNVISGEMSFIGPRPRQPDVVEGLSKLIPHYRDRACLKPGVTGWAQVKYPCCNTLENACISLGYDLFYIKHRSIILHIMIAVATLRIILFSKRTN